MVHVPFSTAFAWLLDECDGRMVTSFSKEEHKFKLVKETKDCVRIEEEHPIFFPKTMR